MRSHVTSVARSFCSGMCLASLVLLVAPPLAVAGEVSVGVVGFGRDRATRWPYTLVTPLSIGEDASLALDRKAADGGEWWPYAPATPLPAADERRFAVTGVISDVGRWPFALTASAAVREDAPLAINRIEDGEGGRWSLAQPSPSTPAEEAPIPIEVGKGAEPEPWPYALPFLADKVIKQGYTLPLPRGLSLVYTYIQRDVKITSLKVGIDGAPLRDVSKFVNLGSNSRVNVVAGRFDAWLLPFLNVYALAGYVSNNTTTKGTVTIPPLTSRGEPRTFDLKGETDLGGFVGGVGLTAAAGWRDFFILGDFNFSQTDIGFDNPFRAYIGTVRSGWNGSPLGVPVRLWVGGQYWGTSGTAKSTVSVPDVGSVSFAAAQGPLHPLNALIGGNVTLFKRWELFAEYGFNFSDVQIAAAGLSFRF